MTTKPKRPKDPTDAELEARETSYIQGSRMAWLTMLGECLKHLGYDSEETKRVAWITEREEAIHALRSLCAEAGDNDWPEDLHLADIIQKHLAPHL